MVVSNAGNRAAAIANVSSTDYQELVTWLLVMFLS